MVIAISASAAAMVNRQAMERRAAEDVRWVRISSHAPVTNRLELPMSGAGRRVKSDADASLH